MLAMQTYPTVKAGKYELLPKIELILEYYSGEISFDDLIYFKKTLGTDPKFNFYHTTILDLREATLKLNEIEMVQLLNFFRDSFEVKGIRKVAYLTSKPDQVVLTTLFSSLLIDFQDLKFQPHTFSTIEALANWLKIEDISPNILDFMLLNLKSKSLNAYEKN